MIDNYIQYPYPDDKAQEIAASTTKIFRNNPKKRASILSMGIDLPEDVSLKIIIDGRENAWFYSKGNEAGVIEFPDGVPYNKIETTVINIAVTAQDYHVRYVVKHDTK